jgi:SAM-dependent methyltransferase
VQTNVYKEYWNDEKTERKKPYWIEDVNDRRLITFLRQETNLERCFRDALAFIDRQLGGVRGTVLDLGAGVCWTSAVLSLFPEVGNVHAVDYSQIRLFRIAPLLFKQYEVPEGKIHRHCRDLSSCRFPDSSFDLVLFCQAFYMSGKPLVLLKKVRRVLKTGGVLLIACESIEPSPSGIQRARMRLQSLLSLTGTPPIPRADPSGRRPYQDSHFRHFISAAGFHLKVQELDYPVYKNSSVRATNYFGVKD